MDAAFRAPAINSIKLSTLFGSLKEATNGAHEEQAARETAA
jgi:hypothetical protein